MTTANYNGCNWFSNGRRAKTVVRRPDPRDGRRAKTVPSRRRASGRQDGSDGGSPDETERGREIRVGTRGISKSGVHLDVGQRPRHRAFPVLRFRFRRLHVGRGRDNGRGWREACLGPPRDEREIFAGDGSGGTVSATPAAHARPATIRRENPRRPRRGGVLFTRTLCIAHVYLFPLVCRRTENVSRPIDS